MELWEYGYRCINGLSLELYYRVIMWWFFSILKCMNKWFEEMILLFIEEDNK